MDPLDSRITKGMVIEQERKLRDIVRVASATVKGVISKMTQLHGKQQTIR
jgi:hypothetical protein